MNTSESLGYVKGLIDGLKLDKDSDEAKVFAAIIDVLENIIEDVQEMDDDLGDLEDIVYGDDEWDDDEWDDEDFIEEYEVECPGCGTAFEVDEETLLSGSVECPNCGETLEFEFEADEDEDDFDKE